MGVNKFVITENGEDRTLFDLTGDSVAPETLAEGETAHSANGERIVGTMPTSTVLYTEQSLTSEQQTQARVNIRAMSSDNMISSTMVDMTQIVQDVEFANNKFGVVLESENNSRYRVLVKDDGTLATTHQTYEGNQVSVSQDTDGTVYNGCGYMTGYRINSSGENTTYGRGSVTGFIPVSDGYTLLLTGWDFSTTGHAGNVIAVYDANFTYLGSFTSQPSQYGLFSSTLAAYAFSSVTEQDGVFSWTVPSGANISFVRIAGRDDNSVVNGLTIGHRMVVYVRENGSVNTLYGMSNPPPYPVKSVNGQTGDVKLSAANVGAATLAEGTIYIEGSGTTDSTAKTSTWVGTSNRITAYYDGLAIRYKIGVAGQSTVTLNINGLGEKTVYRFGTTKLTTQFPVGSIITLIYHEDLNDGCWVTNDYDANTNTYQRIYPSTTNVEYPITARYNTTTGSSYYAEYGRYSTGVTLNPSTNTITASTFKGNLNGTATKATQDGSGNNIEATYAKKSEITTTSSTITVTGVDVDGNTHTWTMYGVKQ